MRFDSQHPHPHVLAAVVALLALGGVAAAMGAGSSPARGDDPGDNVLATPEASPSPEDSATPDDSPSPHDRRPRDDDGTPDQGPDCCDPNDDQHVDDN